MDYGDARLPERFWAKVYPEPNTGCWLWGAACGHWGYGKIFWNGKFPQAHVLMARMAGTPGRGPVVRHSCDTPPCVNPEHLLWGTPKENTGDMDRRGRRGTAAPGEKNRHAVLTAEQVLAIRRRTNERAAVLAQEFGVGTTAIHKIIKRKTWSHLSQEELNVR